MLLPKHTRWLVVPKHGAQPGHQPDRAVVPARVTPASALAPHAPARAPPRYPIAPIRKLRWAPDAQRAFPPGHPRARSPDAGGRVDALAGMLSERQAPSE